MKPDIRKKISILFNVDKISLSSIWEKSIATRAIVTKIIDSFGMIFFLMNCVPFKHLIPICVAILIHRNYNIFQINNEE